jgi:hypothetical protein
MHQPESSTRILLPPHVTEYDVRSTALDLGWIPLGNRPATEDRRYEYIWEDEVARVYIHFVLDDVLATVFLYLHGEDTAAVEREIRDRLPTSTLEEARAQLRAAQDSGATIDAIRRIAALEPAADTEIGELLTAAAGEPDRNVRRAVASAIGYLEWPSLLSTLERLKDRDPDGEVREDARTIWDAIAAR